MSALCLSFEGWLAAQRAARPTKVLGRTIFFRGRGFTHRRLRAYDGKRVRFFIEMEPYGDEAICFDRETGHYICSAKLRRRDEGESETFMRALDFDPQALRKLYRKFTPTERRWGVEPWHKHLAHVFCAVIFEGPGHQLMERSAL